MRRLSTASFGSQLLQITGDRIATVFEKGPAAEEFARVDLAELRSILLHNSQDLKVAEQNEINSSEPAIATHVWSAGVLRSFR